MPSVLPMEATNLTAIINNIEHPCQDSGEQIASRSRQLYEAAKQKAWNAARDLEWPAMLPIDKFPVTREGNPLAGFEPFEQLPPDIRRQIAWQQHALEINDILHGEQAALLLAAQLVNSLPDGQGKLFASSQVADEARHVEFFARYMQVLNRSCPDCQVQPPTRALALLINDALIDPRWEMKLINCQILIESLALSRFQELRRSTRIPVLRAALKLILRDEARHTHFGITELRDCMREVPEVSRQQYGQHVLDQTVQLIHGDTPVAGLATRHGWDSRALQQHLRRYRLSRIDVVRSRLQQLHDNMRDAGLLTDTTLQRLMRLGLRQAA